jgi:hypothetical protein
MNSFKTGDAENSGLSRTQLLHQKLNVSDAIIMRFNMAVVLLEEML